MSWIYYQEISINCIATISAVIRSNFLYILAIQRRITADNWNVYVGKLPKHLQIQGICTDGAHDSYKRLFKTRSDIMVS